MQLFKRAVAKILSTGGHSLFLRVLKVSPFQSFYLRCGAQIVDLEDNQIEGQAYDHLIYAWDNLGQTENGGPAGGDDAS
jgi:hypothetical protein